MINRYILRSQRAFTLIELLVVIAIIAILAAILFPVFAQAREKGRQTACASNTRQIAMAFYQYTMDFDETFPIESYSLNMCGPVWVDMLMPYVKNADVFHCPSIERRVNPTSAHCGANEQARTAFWTNAYLHRFFPRGWPNRNAFTPLTWAQIPHTASTIAFCEGDVSWGHRGHFINPTNPATYAWMRQHFPALTRRTDNRHMEGGNYPFIDGHAKWLRPDQVRTTAAYNAGDPDVESGGFNLPRNDGQNPWFRP
ncbi:MAG: prepilin-type N-terminal cleavage/methylation domain-containing protein [Fimbriimonadia bacterium]|nr:prepilin-type N-terminal cleavage/methylation domain-containing protein [Fimbriimonadia bacterium]